jgi:RNA polymerase sigma-70 factor, ECF subfamily
MADASDLLQSRIVELLPRLRRFARALTGNPHDADDLLQTALERGLARITQWQPDTRLDSWLYAIVKNAWIDELRSHRRRARVLEDAALLEQIPDPALETAVALVLIEGLPYKEAAQIIGVPIGTLTSRLARARQALQELLEPGDAA